MRTGGGAPVRVRQKKHATFGDGNKLASGNQAGSFSLFFFRNVTEPNYFVVYPYRNMCSERPVGASNSHGGFTLYSVYVNFDLFFIYAVVTSWP